LQNPERADSGAGVPPAILKSFRNSGRRDACTTSVNRDLKSESSWGQMRETFFINQLKGVAKITAGVVGDFTIDGKHHFEVGGKGKTFRQLQGVENGYVVADQIEIGHGNKIPLYLFGFLY